VRTLSSLMRTRENFPVVHPSQIAPSQARLTWRFFLDRLPKKKMHLVGMDTLLILLSLGPGHHHPTGQDITSGETRPELWLADYRLACQLGETDDDNLIILNLPLFLSDAARAWLEPLPPAQLSDWDDLVKAFARHFQGTYVHPRNSWDLRSYRQQPGESLREYIRWFSKQRTELPNITDSDIIGAFLAGTTCRDLVSKLGRKTPTKASELMDIATKFASGQEAVEAIFRKDKQPQGRQKEDVPEASAPRGTKKKTRKKAQAKRDAVDADLVSTAEHRNPRKPPRGANMFDKMLKESCPYHRGPVKHTLEECERSHFGVPRCGRSPLDLRSRNHSGGQRRDRSREMRRGACTAHPEVGLLHQRGAIRDQDPLPTNPEATVRSNSNTVKVATLLRVSSGDCGVILPPGRDHPVPRGLG
jgi:hypothetical protein